MAGLVALTAALLTGLVYRPLNALAGDSLPVVLVGTLGYLLGTLWDISVGVVLWRWQERRLSAKAECSS